MNYTKHTRKNGSTYYRFRYREWIRISEFQYEKYKKEKIAKASSSPRLKKEGNDFYYEKNQTVPSSKTNHIKTKEKAEEWKLKWEAKWDARLRERQKREFWHDKYYNFENLYEIYLKAREKRSPNSYKDQANWFRNYVLVFFLEQKSCSNLEEWKQHFIEFKNWLSETQSIRSKKALSLASQNHCIIEANVFLEIMAENKKCDPQPKLKTYSDREINNTKNEDSVISDEEFKKISDFLKRRDKERKTSNYYFYYLMFHTGMRISELLGLNLQDIKSDPPKDEALKNLLKNSNIKLKSIHGSIIICKQLSKRDPKTNRPIFKPLKWKKDMSYENSKYIPIFDKKAWNIIVDLVENALNDYEDKKYGSNASDYLLFEKITKNSFSAELRLAYETELPNVKRKTSHDSRHTLSTNIAKRSGFSLALPKMLLGHSEKTAKRYNHLVESVTKKLHHNNKDFENLKKVS